jgi:hypothetical protein
LLLQPDVDGVQLVVAVHGRAEGAAPRDVIGEVPVGHAGVVFVPTCLQFFDKVGHRADGLLRGGII